MIEQITINDFKCFSNETFTFKPLTLLTGTNSSGKSSLIQSILLSGNHASGSDLLEYIRSMGNFDDLKNKYVNPETYTVSIDFTEGESNSVLGSKVSFGLQDGQFNAQLTYPSRLTYLNSNRLTISEMNSSNTILLNDRYFGIDGKFIAHYYELHKDEPIEEYLIKNPDFPRTLEAQVEYWLKEIVDQSLRFQTEELSSTTIKAFYELDGLEFKPNNIGAGVSYLVTILVACLSAKMNNIIIVENPEIHLHPKAQSRLIDFLTFIANNGVQIILESHSDHIFNGIRKNIYLYNHSETVNKSFIDEGKVSIHYFDKNKRLPIVLDDAGQVKNHQEGLFDQFDDDLNALLGLSWM